MHSKIHHRPSGGAIAVGTARPLLLHDVTNTTTAATAASRRRLLAGQPAPGTANRARHHGLDSHGPSVWKEAS